MEIRMCKDTAEAPGKGREVAVRCLGDLKARVV